MASASGRRRMLIDDNLGEVKYSGDWFLDTYERPGPLQWVGSAAKQTAHGINTTGGLSFSFEGSSFSAQGQSNVVPSTTNSVLTCKVDGVDGNTAVFTPDNINNWALCGAARLSEGRHEVVINITTGPNTVFWLDDIYYLSGPNPILRRKYSMFVPNAGEYRYAGVGWANPFDNDGLFGRETYTNGSKVIMPLYGESVELTAYLTSEMPRTAGAGSYTIDGETPVPFSVPTWTSGFRGGGPNRTLYRVRLFETDPVPPGYHTLEVTNLGNSNTVPLPVDYLYVSHGDVDDITATAQTSSIPATAQSATTTSTSAVSTGTQTPPITNTGTSDKTSPWPLVGGAVGAVLVLVLAALLGYIWLLRRKRWTKVEGEDRLTPEEAWNLNMQSRDLAVATRPYDTGPTPPAYSATTLSYGHVYGVTPLQMSTSSTDEVPLRTIPPQKHRFFTTPTNGQTGSISSISSAQSPAAESPIEFQQAIPGSGAPRRLPPRIPLKKGPELVQLYRSD